VDAANTVVDCLFNKVLLVFEIGGNLACDRGVRLDEDIFAGPVKGKTDSFELIVLDNSMFKLETHDEPSERITEAPLVYCVAQRVPHIGLCLRLSL